MAPAPLPQQLLRSCSDAWPFIWQEDGSLAYSICSRIVAGLVRPVPAISMDFTHDEANVAVVPGMLPIFSAEIVGRRYVGYGDHWLYFFSRYNFGFGVPAIFRSDWKFAAISVDICHIDWPGTPSSETTALF